MKSVQRPTPLKPNQSVETSVPVSSFLVQSLAASQASQRKRMPVDPASVGMARKPRLTIPKVNQGCSKVAGERPQRFGCPDERFLYS